MALENLLLGILSIISIVVIIFCGILAYAIWKVGDYSKALLLVAIAVFLFLFFFGHFLGLPRCFGLC